MAGAQAVTLVRGRWSRVEDPKIGGGLHVNHKTYAWQPPGDPYRSPRPAGTGHAIFNGSPYTQPSIHWYATSNRGICNPRPPCSPFSSWVPLSLLAPSVSAWTHELTHVAASGLGRDSTHSAAQGPSHPCQHKDTGSPRTSRASHPRRRSHHQRDHSASQGMPAASALALLCSSCTSKE